MINDTQIGELLRTAKTIAVVGLSSNPLRASFSVAEYMQQQGYRIIPVNPMETEVLGEKCYGCLSDVPEDVDIVDIFRKSETVPEIVDEAIVKGVKLIWMQQGVHHEDAAKKAAAAGIPSVMDECILKVHHRLEREKSPAQP